MDLSLSHYYKLDERREPNQKGTQPDHLHLISKDNSLSATQIYGQVAKEIAIMHCVPNRPPNILQYNKCQFTNVILKFHKMFLSSSSYDCLVSTSTGIQTLLFTVQCTTVQSLILQLHVICLSVRLVDQEHIGWKSWKLIARTISQTPSLFVAQRPSTYSQGNVGKFWGHCRWGGEKWYAGVGGQKQQYV